MNKPEPDLLHSKSIGGDISPGSWCFQGYFKKLIVTSIGYSNEFPPYGGRSAPLLPRASTIWNVRGS